MSYLSPLTFGTPAFLTRWRTAHRQGYQLKFFFPGDFCPTILGGANLHPLCLNFGPRGNALKLPGVAPLLLWCSKVMTPYVKVGGYQISGEACCLRRCQNIKSDGNLKHFTKNCGNCIWTTSVLKGALLHPYAVTALVNCLAVTFSAHKTVMGNLVSLLKNGFLGHSI